MNDRGSISERERRAWTVLLKGGFVLLVAASAALIGVRGDADLPVIGGLALGGAAFGTLLLWYLSRMDLRPAVGRR